jgi:hypothetical protein
MMVVFPLGRSFKLTDYKESKGIFANRERRIGEKKKEIYHRALW